MVARLRKRRDFVRAARGARAERPTLTLQAVAGAPDEAPRAGFTVTKKTGNAVVRNRIRRRLRAALGQETLRLRQGVDYVVLARRAALTASFAGLCEDLAQGIAAAHKRLDRRATETDRREPNRTASKGRP